MPDLSPFSYNVIYNLLSLTVATMGAASIFLFFAPNVSWRYRLATVISGLVTAIAMYHYWQISASFTGAFALNPASGMFEYQPSHPYNNFYRYADWLLTVPLLVVELVAVLALSKAASRKLLGVLVPAVVLMIVLGYPGQTEISAQQAGRDASSAMIWGFFVASMIPFLVIVATLFTKLSQAITDQSGRVKRLVNLARLVLVVTWSFYPIAYVIGALGGVSESSVVGLQVGYTLADIFAKAGFGLLIYAIARAKTDEDPQAWAGDRVQPINQSA